MEYLRFGMFFLTNPYQHYNAATLEGKQKILGSIFPEKLIFAENSYRTAESNEIIELLCSIDSMFGEGKKKKVAIFGDLFLKVTPVRIELTTQRLRVFCSTS